MRVVFNTKPRKTGYALQFLTGSSGSKYTLCTFSLKEVACLSDQEFLGLHTFHHTQKKYVWGNFFSSKTVFFYLICQYSVFLSYSIQLHKEQIISIKARHLLPFSSFFPITFVHWKELWYKILFGQNQKIKVQNAFSFQEED